jgi:hypothetical protein
MSQKENVILHDSEVISVAELRVSKTLRLLRVEGVGVKTVMLAKWQCLSGARISKGGCATTPLHPWNNHLLDAEGEQEEKEEHIDDV